MSKRDKIRVGCGIGHTKQLGRRADECKLVA